MKREINYAKLIDNAMHSIVKEALRIAADGGLPGDHHFFISFLTFYPGVVVSDKLRAKYPEEMTIVLQYQFDDLTLTDDHFSVVLSFDNVKERVVVPFLALTAFADPSVKFGLQFRHIEEPYNEELFDELPGDEIHYSPSYTVSSKKDNGKKLIDPSIADPNPLTSATTSTNVVDLNAFRKKHDK